jgi:hypothetical protein
MPRNSSGTYSLPTGNPVVTGTLIESVWANTTMADLGAALTESLDRNGRGSMLAPLLLTTGTPVAPALSFSAETTSGLYRQAAGVLGFSVAGIERFTISAATALFTTTPRWAGPPVDANDLVPKGYVDGKLVGEYLPLVGGTLAGPGNLTVSGLLTVGLTIDAGGAISSGGAVSSVTPNGVAPFFHLGQSGVSSWDIVSPAGLPHLFINDAAPGGGIRLSILGGNGNIGIGLTAPTSKLHIHTNGNDAIRFSRDVASQSPFFIQTPADQSSIVVQAGVSSGTFSAIELISWNGSGIVPRVALYVAGSEKMRITSNGNVGIGTDTPDANARLHIFKPGAPAVIIAQNDITSQAYFRSKTTLGDWGVGTGIGVAANAWTVYDLLTSAERMRIDSVGNVGIGTAAPNQKLVVAAASGPAWVQVETPTNAAYRGMAFCAPGGATQFGSVGMQLDSGELRITAGLAGFGGFTTFHTNGLERGRFSPSGDFNVGAPQASYGADTRTISAGGAGINQAIFDINIAGTRTAFFTAVVGRAILGTIGDTILDFMTNNVTRASISGAGVFTYAGNEVGWRDIPVSGFPNWIRGTMDVVGGAIDIPVSTTGAVHSVLNVQTTPITLTPVGITLTLAGTTLTGPRTLARNGIATIWYNTPTVAYISGPGVS